MTWSSAVRSSGTAYTAVPRTGGNRPRIRSTGAQAKFSESTRSQSPDRPAK